MARKRQSQLFPMGPCPEQPGGDDPAYAANAELVVDLLNEHGKHIHWWHGEGEACRCRAEDLGPDEDPDDGPPISVVFPPGDPAGSTSALALSLAREHSWVGTIEHGWLGKYRLEFERVLSASRPDMLEAIRVQLDGAYRRQDGAVVVAILPEHVFVTTCVDRSLMN
jgi:hypothetical protein